jgi:ABC-2 type transport system permease protein
MRAITALVKREYLEHKGAFLYAPIVLLAILTVSVLFGVLSGHAEFDLPASELPLGVEIYRVGIAGGFAMWSAYLLIGLFFYYADSFSSDRRNNTLLFWKSMPQSDLKVMACKALSGITIFLGIIFLFALMTAVLIYLILVLAAQLFPIIAAPGLGAAIWTFIQMGVVGAIYLVVTVLWYAPGLAWVAGLSTLLRRWSIPLAFLIPGTVILLEFLNSLRGGARPVADFLAWRFEGFMDDVDVGLILIGQSDRAPIALLGSIFANIDWLNMIIGLVFTAVVGYLASEYRRRRIAA